MLSVLSIEKASDWKLEFIKLTFLFRLTRQPRLISLALWATELLHVFSLAQEQNLLAPGIRTWVFSCYEYNEYNYTIIVSPLILLLCWLTTVMIILVFSQSKLYYVSLVITTLIYFFIVKANIFCTNFIVQCESHPFPNWFVPIATPGFHGQYTWSVILSILSEMTAGARDKMGK